MKLGLGLQWIKLFTKKKIPLLPPFPKGEIGSDGDLPLFEKEG
jgi:hypothetical protein